MDDGGVWERCKPALKRKTSRVNFDNLPYAERIVSCERPENVAGPVDEAWETAGLKATAAWTISTETEAAGIKKGNNVQGTVCLVLRKRVSNEPGFLDEIYPMVEDEVRRQIDSMQALDEGD